MNQINDYNFDNQNNYFVIYSVDIGILVYSDIIPPCDSQM